MTIILTQIGRTKRRRAGTILVTAIFIAIFLFFLSVALVAQNRQNILLVLSEDHRLRATNSANAALDLAVHVMRHNPNWPKLLPGYTGQLESGGEWKIKSISKTVTSPHLLDIEVEGNSRLFASRRQRIVEEIAFANTGKDSLAPTHLFAYALQGSTPVLAVLTPDMRWKLLENPIHPGLPWLVANGGPLFTQSPIRDQNFTIQDISKDGILSNIILESQTYPLTFLRIRNDNLDWSGNKYPCNSFQNNGEGSSTNTDSTNFSPGSGGEKLTKYTEAAVRNLTYDGPTLEWYTSVGHALVAKGNDVYCHGIHHYYQGTSAQIGSKTYTITKASKTYTAPAVLRYNCSSDTWSVVMDAMRVIDRHSDPAIDASVKNVVPNTNTLACVDGTIYCQALGNKKRVLRASSSAWNDSRNISGQSLGLYEYDHHLMFHQRGKIGDAVDQIDLNQASPLDDLYAEHSAIKTFEGLEVRPAFKVIPEVLLASAHKDSECVYNGNNSVAICGNHIYTYVSLHAALAQPQEALRSLFPNLYEDLTQRYTNIGETKLEGLAHFDGERWQLWPNGINDVTANWSLNVANARLRWIYDRHTDQAAKLLFTNIAAARYPEVASQQNIINRYTVILDKDKED